MVAKGLSKYSFVTNGFYVPEDATFRDSVCSEGTCFSKRDLPLLLLLLLLLSLLFLMRLKVSFHNNRHPGYLKNKKKVQLFLVIGLSGFKSGCRLHTWDEVDDSENVI